MKENKSPEKINNGDSTTNNYYDPFGDKDYKAQFFQNSANNFNRRRPNLEIDSASVEDRQTINQEEGTEESKNGLGRG
jgi:hypothetical protein